MRRSASSAPRSPPTSLSLERVIDPDTAVTTVTMTATRLDVVDRRRRRHPIVSVGPANGVLTITGTGVSADITGLTLTENIGGVDIGGTAGHQARHPQPRQPIRTDHGRRGHVTFGTSGALLLRRLTSPSSGSRCRRRGRSSRSASSTLVTTSIGAVVNVTDGSRLCSSPARSESPARCRHRRRSPCRPASPSSPLVPGRIQHDAVPRCRSRWSSPATSCRSHCRPARSSQVTRRQRRAVHRRRGRGAGRPVLPPRRRQRRVRRIATCGHDRRQRVGGGEGAFLIVARRHRRHRVRLGVGVGRGAPAGRCGSTTTLARRRSRSAGSRTRSPSPTASCSPSRRRQLNIAGFVQVEAQFDPGAGDGESAVTAPGCSSVKARPSSRPVSRNPSARGVLLTGVNGVYSKVGDTTFLYVTGTFELIGLPGITFLATNATIQIFSGGTGASFNVISGASTANVTGNQVVANGTTIALGTKRVSFGTVTVGFGGVDARQRRRGDRAARGHVDDRDHRPARPGRRRRPLQQPRPRAGHADQHPGHSRREFDGRRRHASAAGVAFDCDGGSTFCFDNARIGLASTPAPGPSTCRSHSVR